MSRRYAMVVLLAVAALVASCQRVETLAAVLNYNLSTEPPTLDPALTTDGVSIFCTEQLFLALTDFEDTINVPVIPELATQWSASNDGLTWTFTMRTDGLWVRYDPATEEFEKKRPVTAHDIEYGVKRTCNPETASDYAYVDYIIAGCKEVNTGESGNLDSIGVKALDDHTIQFTLREPGAYLPAIAGLWINRPVPREPIEEFGDLWTEPGNIWTNGPFALDTWEHENRIVFVKNPHWYDAQKVSIKRVNALMISSDSTAFAMYETGELDTVPVPLEDLDRVRADPVLSKEFVNIPDLATYYYGFNLTKPPADNPLVRQALSYAVDRQKLVDTVLKGGELPAWSFACPGIFGNVAQNPDFPGITYNPEKARALLAKAGYPDGAGFPEIVLMLNTRGGHQKIAEFIQKGWKETLGIDVKLANQEWKAYLQTLNTDPPQVFGMGWGADYPDQNNWVREVFHPTESANLPHWSGPEADRFAGLVEDAARVTDAEERKKLYFEAEKILCVDQAVIIPIYYYTIVGVAKPYLQRTCAFAGGEHVWKWKVKVH